MAVLVAITANKYRPFAVRPARAHGAGNYAIEDLISREPSPDFACQVAEQLAHLLARLDRTGDPSARQVAALRMRELTQAETGRARLRPRTVTWKLRRSNCAGPRRRRWGLTRRRRSGPPIGRV